MEAKGTHHDSHSLFFLVHFLLTGVLPFYARYPNVLLYDTQFLYRMNKTQDSCHVMLEADELYVVT